MSSIKILERLPTWGTLSIRDQFIKRTQNIPVFFEEQPKINNGETKQPPIYCELRIDGPFIKPLGGRHEIEAVVEVNVVITAQYDEKNTQSLNKLSGIVLQALLEDFCIYKLGAEPCDDKSYFDIYQLIPDDNIEQSNFGQVDPTNKVYQSTVEGHYKVRFRNGTV